MHVDAAVVSLGVPARQDLQQSFARKHASRPVGEGAQQRELTGSERNLLARGIEQAAARDVQTKSGEPQLRLDRVILGGAFERPGDAGDQAGFIRDIDDIAAARERRGARRHQENFTDSGSQFIHQAARIRTDTLRIDDRQGETPGAELTNPRGALGDLDATSFRREQSRKARSHRDVPGDDKDRTTHWSWPRSPPTPVTVL